MPSQATRALRRRRRRGVLSPLPLPPAPTPCAPVRHRRARWRTHLHHNHRDHRGIGARVRAGSPTMTGQCEISTHGRSEINREIRYETTWDTTQGGGSTIFGRRRCRQKNKRYVVQTAASVIQRCILMTTDPADLVFDPTCGSGTTAEVAEDWGRRWIACDTSRVAVAIARQRLMTTNFDYYELAHPSEGVGAGFSYRSVPKVSPRTLGYDEPPNKTVLYDQPHIDRAKARVTGPFTVEAVPAPAVRPLDDIETSKPLPADDSVARAGPAVQQGDWRDELLKAGIRGKAGQRVSFARLEPLPGTRWLHAEGETRPDDTGADGYREPAAAYDAVRVVVSSGPDHTPLEQRQVSRAVEEAQLPRPETEGHRLRRFPVRPRSGQGHRRDPLARRDVVQSADERRPADRRPQEEAGGQRELLADRSARRGGRARHRRRR